MGDFEDDDEKMRRMVATGLVSIAPYRHIAIPIQIASARARRDDDWGSIPPGINVEELEEGD